MAIDALRSSIPSLPSSLPSQTTGSTAATGFGDTLKQLLNSVEDKAGDANVAIGHMLDGTGDVHEAMIAMQQADTMLQLTVQIRNKLVQAYQDVMRMPV
jgi:flagellar hook-basal body complex protein FliE